MTDFDGRDDTTVPVQADTRLGTPLELSSHPWAFAGLALASGVLGALVVKALVKKRLAFTTGDEPPIRVRNGSLDVEVLDDRDSWTDQEPSTNPGRMWKLTLGRHRAGSRFQVIVSLRQHAACKAHLPVVEATRIEITYSDGTEVSFTAAGRQTLVRVETEGRRLTIANQKCVGNRCLEYASRAGYIKKLVTRGGGGHPLECTFTSAADLRGLYIFDW